MTTGTRMGVLAWTVGLTMAALAPSRGLAATDMSDEPVFRSVNRVQRTYVSHVYAPKDALLQIWTETDSGSITDPVLFLVDPDVNGADGLPAVVAASDDAWTGTKDAKIMYSSPGVNKWIRVILMAYDNAYSGPTDLKINTAGTTTTVTDAWAGGNVYKTYWGKGDTFTMTGQYVEYALESMCLDTIGSRPMSVSVAWDHASMTCTSTFQAKNAIGVWFDKTEVYTRGTICQEGSKYLFTSAGVPIPVYYNWINAANPVCQYVSDASDSLALAVGNWSKIDKTCTSSWLPPVGGAPAREIWSCQDAALWPEVRGYDDDSGTGRHFRMTMTNDAPTTPGTPPVVMFALMPWITNWQAHYADPANPAADDVAYASLADDECSLAWRDAMLQNKPASAAVEAQCPGGMAYAAIAQNAYQPYVRLYHDQSVEWSVGHDSDNDGLSYSLEVLLGTDPNNPDTDFDGIIDGLEVYGPLVPARNLAESEPVEGSDFYGRSVGRYFPLPLYGANPKRKDIIFEMDLQQDVVLNGGNVAAARARSLEAAGEILNDSGLHLIVVAAGPNANTEVPDNTPVFRYRRENGHNVRITNTPRQLLVAQQRTTPGDWAISSAQAEMDIAPTFFDLQEYPFVRYMFLANTASSDRRLCGEAAMKKVYSGTANDGLTHSLPYGRTMVMTAVRQGQPYPDLSPGRRCWDAYTVGTRTMVSAMTHEIGHLLGAGHSGFGWKQRYQYAPNYWSLMSYGFRLPLAELEVKSGNSWVVQPVPALPDGNNDGRPDDLRFSHRLSYADTPPHFTKGAAFRAIDEANLNELGGLLGDGTKVVFNDIRDRWSGVAGTVYVPEIRVGWVDWNRNKSKATNPLNYDELIFPNVSFAQDATDVDGDGTDDSSISWPKNCYKSGSDGKWVNATTKVTFGKDDIVDKNKACRDQIANKFTVSNTRYVGDVDQLNAKVAARSLPETTYENETEYLKHLDMSAWSWGTTWDGLWQQRLVGSARFVAQPFVLIGGDKRVEDLPTEYTE